MFFLRTVRKCHNWLDWRGSICGKPLVLGFDPGFRLVQEFKLLSLVLGHAWRVSLSALVCWSLWERISKLGMLGRAGKGWEGLGRAGKGWEGLGIVPPGPWSALSTHCYHNGSTVSPKAKWFRLEYFRCQILSNEDSQWQLQAVKHGACKNSSFQEWCFTTVHEAVLHCASTWALFVSLFYYIVFLKDKALIRIPRSIVIHMQMMRHGTPVAPFLFSFCAQIGSLHRLAILVRICPH